jgi:DNA-directed RNA polymerase subunit beta'
MRDLTEISQVQIGIASAERIRGWSYGEVTKPETINYRTLKPERDGLFDERVFGPERDWECACGKYRGQRFAGKVCERCGVEITKSTVRRYRMGHIELATPSAHIWYVKDIPSKIGSLLNLSTSQLEQVLYFAKYIITDPQGAKLDGRPLRRGDLLTDDEYRQLRYGMQETYTVSQGEDAVVGDGRGDPAPVRRPVERDPASGEQQPRQYRHDRDHPVDGAADRRRSRLLCRGH